ncbi:dihydrofolate reductase family protein [Candidatus Woesebacteria bacterium]|nr:dihydrofolate reductase family protein [Candidatus Woesebacteria bacterium]
MYHLMVFFAGPNGEIDWFVQDPEVDVAVHDPERTGDCRITILGGTTYKLFEESWVPFLSDPDAPEEMKAVAEDLTNMTKVVFSEKIKETNWANTELHNGELINVAKKLKEGDSDIIIFGSGTIVQQLANEDLIDEYLLIVTPVVLNEGKPLFKDVKHSHLRLLGSQSFGSGNVLLHYLAA